MEQLLRFSIQYALNTEGSQYERLGGLYSAYTLHSSQPSQQPQAMVGSVPLTMYSIAQLCSDYNAPTC